MVQSESRPRRRRHLLTSLASVTVAGVLAGCGGDGVPDGNGVDSPDGNANNSPDGGGAESPAGSGGDSKDDVDEIAEQALQKKEDAGTAIKSAIGHAQEEKWQQCHGDIENVPTQLGSARQDARRALGLAEERGYTARIKAFNVLIDIIDLFDQVHTELVTLCDAGSRGDQQEVGERWESIRAIVDDIEQKEEELARIMEENN